MPAKLGKSAGERALAGLWAGRDAFALCSREWTVPQILFSSGRLKA